jgi:hypothetical protein
VKKYDANKAKLAHALALLERLKLQGTLRARTGNAVLAVR